MRGLILAAGRTSHMGEIGDQQPKCLVPLAGTPLIARQIAALRGGGATEIGVVRGFRAEMIDYPDITYFENERWADTNTVMSLASADAWLRSGPVIVERFGHLLSAGTGAPPGVRPRQSGGGL